jgi:hypothetical protein
MRARNIKPGFFTNETLADLPHQTRLFFIGLWCAADRDGRLEDRPRKIKALIFPYEDADVDGMLDDLQRTGFVIRYSVDSCDYIQVVNFNKHQTPHIKEKASTIPAPDKHGASTVLAPPDSLIPDSLIPDSLNRFWSLYPRRVSKGQAQRALAAALKKTDINTILAALERQLPDLNRREKKYIPYPSTWLNGERWEDDVTVAPTEHYDEANEALMEELMR